MSRNKAIVLSVAFLLVSFFNYAQKKKPPVIKPVADAAPKKYKSLLWEITGNGLNKPSYLFGTMHVSNKLVFNLSDSFYRAIRNVDVVALEQNPEVWQEEFAHPEDSEQDNSTGLGAMADNYRLASDRMSVQTFGIGNYEARIKLALASEARMVNGMLYRNNVGMEDFEEETYLDMYIYRLGRKLNKMITGVEDYKESRRLVKEAYTAMYKDKNRKASRSYDGYGDKNKMEEAYKRGDLDMLDSLQMLSVVSEAFQEKFMYRRNEIQSNSIDTIIHRHSLFVGVGAAHLPGARGVIELLRKKGYKLRPVYMGQRDSEEKERVEKIRVPVTFSRQYAEDSLFSVEMPGKLFRYKTFGQQNMVQYADMSNGSYYMVTRIKTDAALFGHAPALVLKKIDSLLYENIPGRIVQKKAVVKDGFNGFDITNRTRKGDLQRYNIYVLPNEVLIFKISGMNDYITEGKEAGDFFTSIQIPVTDSTDKNNVYRPPYGGFEATFPAKPVYISAERNDRDRSEWISADSKGNSFFIFKSTIQQYDYIEEDTFELRLMEESFKSSKIFSQVTDGKFGAWHQYPVINAAYQHQDGDDIKVRYLIQGNNYYVIGAKTKHASTEAERFINSFSITPWYYAAAQERKDTSIGFTVKSPVFYKIGADSASNALLKEMLTSTEDDDRMPYAELLNSFAMKNIGNDTTGEHINIMFVKLPRFTYVKDSSGFNNKINFLEKKDNSFLTRWKQSYTTSNGWRCTYQQCSDTGSSRTITAKSLYKKGILFYLVTQGDTITPASAFVKTFFDTFEPADTFAAVDPFEKKAALFFSEYFGKDSSLRKKASRSILPDLFEAGDLPQIKQAIAGLSWKDRRYLEQKKAWIGVTGNFKDTASLNYLVSLYPQVKDTSDLQNAVLDALLDRGTAASFNAFKDLVVTEPPALTTNDAGNYGYNLQLFTDAFIDNEKPRKISNFYGFKWRQLYDTLPLAAKIAPGILDLMILDDYKEDVIKLLRYTVDSGYLKADDYQQHFNRFLLEAKQSLKKKIAEQEQQAMNELTNKDANVAARRGDDDYRYKGGDDDLSSYAVLLMPFWDRSAEVPSFFNRLLKLKDKRIRTSAAILMLRNRKPVSDSLVNTIAADDDDRLKLYNSLKAGKLLQKFPAKYLHQQDIARSLLKAASYYSDVDTMVYIDRLQVAEPKQKGWVYFFRYKKSKDDAEWKIACSGLQPSDTLKISTGEAISDEADDDNYNDFTAYTQEVYNESVPVKPVLQTIIKKALYKQRPSAVGFYSRDTDEDDSESYAVDAAKSRRYD